MSDVKKTAVVLLNLGGPDSLSAVEPFLFNLFYDPAIISLPNPLRYLIAKWISGKRVHEAKEIYSVMGGRSPILTETHDQARALEGALGPGYKVFIAMRYWSPRAEEVMEKIQKEGVYKEIMLLPLYPQLSLTTTDSSYKEWMDLSSKHTCDIPVRFMCCYPEDDLFVGAYADLVDKAVHKAGNKDPSVRVLFSAHGLPESKIKAGDPYQKQVEKTVRAVVSACETTYDYKISYQSRVGPVKWIEPATDDEIKRAGQDHKKLIIVPIAFVSEHSETKVELDVEYEELADEVGITYYDRVPTVGTHPKFMEALCRIAKGHVPPLGCDQMCRWRKRCV